MAVFDDSPRDTSPPTAQGGAAAWPRAVAWPGAVTWPGELDPALDHCEWCARLRQADGSAPSDGSYGSDGSPAAFALSAHMRAARRNDSVAVRRRWPGVWRGRGLVVLWSAATAAIVSGVLAVALG
ncbi:hypothetical protein [Streptomyces sp. NPDC023327]|uniref:hypothetical protein n=1 Tax=Streptomyces sp. NPDC023327 TaxID=3157088 RepID=UPI0033DC1111